MEVKTQKTVRFDHLVQSYGRPEQVVLWTKPEQDRAFMRAAEENRVVTIVQPNVGAKKDFGLVGFVKVPKAAFLLFPKPLAYEFETRVVGIKYDRLAQAKAKDRFVPPQTRVKPPLPKPASR